MICPHCSIAELPDDGGPCPLCGFSPSGSVLIERRVVDEVLEYIQDILADQFEIRAVLGLGTRSFVYLARDIARNRLLALKVLPATAVRDAAMVQRFERQAALYGSLQHAQIVPLVAYGVARSFLWYTMGLAQGEPLAIRLRGSRPMEPDACLRIVEQVAGALAYAHRRGVVHGNLKPTNVFLDDAAVQVSDFAMWGVWGTASQPKAGTHWLPEPEYRAPEHSLQRAVGPAADQYALGIVAFQCLTGTLPFVGDSDEEVARQHATAAPPPLALLRPELPAHVADAVAQALAKSPRQRFPGVVEFAAALNGRATASPVAQPSPPAWRTTAPRLLVVEPDPEDVARQRRRRRRWIAALGLLLIGGTSGGVLWHRKHQAPPTPISPADFVVDSGEMRVRRDTVSPAPLPPLHPSAPDAAAAGSAAPAEPASGVARLFVNANPGGRVYVDDQLVGNTPTTAVVVLPGTHRVRVVREGFWPFEQVVQVKPGEVLRLGNIVLQSRPQ